MQLFEIEEIFEQLWPSSGAEEWDAPGFSVSIPSELEHILLTVDVTGGVIAEAEAMGAGLILSHHPFLLRGTKNVNWDDLKGNVLQHAIRAGISIYSAHTNADVVKHGVSDTLASFLGLQQARPLVGDGDAGHGRIGILEKPLKLAQLAEVLVDKLPFSPRGVLAAGDPEALIQTVALCAGAGDAFIDVAFDSGADVYITSDLRHHVALDATQRPRADQSLALLDISHWAAEWIWLTVAKEQLVSAMPNVKITISNVVTDPWTFSMNRAVE